MTQTPEYVAIISVINLQCVLVELNRFISLLCLSVIIMCDCVDCAVGYILKVIRYK